MDFTYWIACALAALVGFIAACFLVAAGKRPARKHYRNVVFSMLAADYVLLVNWRAITLESSWILAADLVFFTIFSAIGAAIGMIPVKGAYAILRRLRR